MTSWPSMARRRQVQTWPSTICTVAGCGRSVYADKVCSEHWERPAVATCGHEVPVVACGACQRQCCVDCYGEWNALACRDCREKARAQAS